GQKLLDNAGEEERYLQALFSTFNTGLLNLRDHLLEDGTPLVRFPRIWAIALSKADLLPEMTSHDLSVMLIEKAGGHMAELRRTIAMMVEGDAALSVGEDFLVLSSAKFTPGRIDVSDRIGVDLLLPLAAALPFERPRAAGRELTGEVRGPRGRKARAGQRGSQSEEPSHDGCAHRIPPRPRASRRGERAAEEQPMSLLWATRGRSWGFRFLRSGGA